jgi:ABC-type transport system involved in multi-copper enzyme maturation permease subunit
MNSLRRLPSTFEITTAVGKVTFLEIIRDRILYNILLIAFFLMGLAFLASRLSFLSPERVILDFGLSAVNLSCCAIGILMGASLMAKEFERRTIFVALSHPVSRAQFLLGKFAGLMAVISLNWFLLSAVYLGILSILARNPSQTLSGTLLVALGFGWIQSLVLAAIAMALSAFSTTSMSVMIAVGFYLIGHNISQIRLLATKIKSPMGKVFLDVLSNLLPNLEYFDLGTKVTYGLPITLKYASLSIFYGFFVVSSFLLIASYFIRNREA